MSKLVLDLRVPDKYDKATLADIIRQLCQTVNQLAENQITAKYNAQTSVPTSTAVSYQVGDFIPDSNCTSRGSVAAGLAAAYVREGWVCTSPGAGGTATFVEKRVLTGS